jgi:hypothetical protein
VSVSLTHPASLVIDGGPAFPASSSVRVRILDPDLRGALCRYLEKGGPPEAVLRVTVAPTTAPIGDALPDVFGRYLVMEDGLRFTPHFPFARGLSYRAMFDPRPLGRSAFQDLMTREFSHPRKQRALATTVNNIFPSSDRLPENLLRFYVCFSSSMQRGRGEAEISLLGPNGERVPDALYRAPVELWDRGMRCLTVMLDPGRLKRGVGANRALGPPLTAGSVYTLSVGEGMRDFSGSRLSEPVCKSFRVMEAVREPIAVEQWQLLPPETDSRQPLVLRFPRPLDWALLSQTISVASAGEQPVAGRIVVDRGETRWSFTPTVPWTAGSYNVGVASSLEDVCGNTVMAAFDRPLRRGGNSRDEMANPSLPFHPV